MKVALDEEWRIDVPDLWPNVWPNLWNVRLDAGFAVNLEDRLELSSGARLVSEAEISRYGYEPEALIPIDDWRRPGPTEFARLLMAGPPVPPHERISIVRLPFDLTDHTRQRIIADDGEGGVQDAMVALLRTMFHTETPPIWLGVTSNDADLPTVTRDQAKTLRIGMHVDSWDDESLGRRHLSTNRICFNLGAEARLFLFAPVTLTACVDAMRNDQPHGGEDKRPTQLARDFLSRTPPCPIVRCRLLPGEGYIAPTENLIHDASSAGTRRRDRQLTVRGRFSLLDRRN